MTTTPEDYEATIDRMGQEIERLRKALDLEAKMRKAAADIADARTELLEEALCALDESFPHVDSPKHSSAIIDLFHTWGDLYWKTGYVPDRPSRPADPPHAPLMA